MVPVICDCVYAVIEYEGILLQMGRRGSLFFVKKQIDTILIRAMVYNNKITVSGREETRMIPCNSINRTIEIFTVPLLCVLIAALLLRRKKNRRDWLFCTVLVLHGVNTLGDLIAWIVAGEPGKNGAD